MTTTSPARPVYENLRKALGTGYFLLNAGLTAEELDYLARTRRYVDDEVLPVINEYSERAEVPLDHTRRRTRWPR